MIEMVPLGSGVAAARSLVDLARTYHAVAHPDPAVRRRSRQYLRDRGGLTPEGKIIYHDFTRSRRRGIYTWLR